MFKKRLLFKILGTVLLSTIAGFGIIVYEVIDKERESFMVERRKTSELMAQPLLHTIYKDMLDERADMARYLIEGMKNVKGTERVQVIRNNGIEEAFQDFKTLKAVEKEYGKLKPEWTKDHPNKEKNVAQGIDNPGFKEALGLFNKGRREGIFYIEEDGGKRLFTYLVPIEFKPGCNACHTTVEKARGILMISTSLEDMYAALASSRMRWIIYGILTISGISILVIFFIRGIIKPLRRLSDAAEDISRGNYNISIPVQTRDEVGNLAESFNIMTRNIKKQTDMLVESEERLRTIMDSSTAVIYLKDLEGRYIIVNKRFEELFHLTNEKLKGKTDYDLFPEDIASAFRKNDVEVIKTRRPLQIEETALHSDGQAHQYLSVKSPILDSKMAIYAVCGISTDITEHKKAEEKITTLSYAVEQSPSIIMITDTKGNIEYVNPSFTQLTGYSSEEVIGKNAEELGNQSPEEKEKMWEAINSNGEWRGEFLNKKKNGESYWEMAVISAIRNPQGITTYFLKAAEDITKHKQMENEIIKGQARLSNAHKIANLGDWEWDIVKNELRWSDEIYRIFGVEPQQFNATYDAFLDSVHPEDRGLVRMAVNNALLGKKPYSIDHRIILPDGTVRVVHEQSEVVFDKAGKAIMMTGTVQDITERKKLEEQFRHAQKMEAIGQLAGGIAHDFNNILTAVNGYANLLLVKKGDAILVKSYTDHILNLSEKAAKLVRDLLSFSRRQPVFIRPTDLNELIREVETIMLHLIGENIEFTANLSDEGITVQIDPPQIEQVLMNLATNARDAMPSGGKLTISTKPAGIDNEFIKRYGYGKAGKYALITFADNGMGMDEATQKKIFEPFFTTKEVGKGTGLGLSMVYGIIKQHGGFINLRSKPASGTTFYIYLPMAEHAEIEAKRHTEEVFIPKREAGVVLLAEDETALRDVTKLILEEYGYTVIEAADGNDAIDKYMENKDKIRLLILDVIMPKKSGKAVYEEISKMSPDIKVIFLSGYARNVINVEEIIGHGWSILSKPVSSDELLNKISEVLNK